MIQSLLIKTRFSARMIARNTLGMINIKNQNSKRCFLNRRNAISFQAEPWKRFYSQQLSWGQMHQKKREQETKNTMYYASSVVVFFIGLSFAAVPLYQLFCSTTGIDGTPKTGAQTKFSLSTLSAPPHARPIKIFFDSSTSSLLPWKFEPETKMVTVKPGESALAFFKAENKGDARITGISTYSVVPYKAAQYFNKIQVIMNPCFRFEKEIPNHL